MIFSYFAYEYAILQRYLFKKDGDVTSCIQVMYRTECLLHTNRKSWNTPGYYFISLPLCIIAYNIYNCCIKWYSMKRSSMIQIHKTYKAAKKYKTYVLNTMQKYACHEASYLCAKCHCYRMVVFPFLLHVFNAHLFNLGRLALCIFLSLFIAKIECSQ